MGGGHRAKYLDLIGVCLLRLLWFGCFFAGTVVAAVWLLGRFEQPGWWMLAAPLSVFALVSGTLLWSEARFLAAAVVWFEPTPAGFRCRLLGRRRIHEVAWTEVIGTQPISRGGRGHGPSGLAYRTTHGRYVMDWWSLPQARALAAPGSSS